jgi:adenylate cyclase
MLFGSVHFIVVIPVNELAQILNQYLAAMTEIILAHGGIIDKQEGDAIMAELAKQGLPELSCRIDINTGNMVVDNMGSDQNFDYTVIGDAVNLASRLGGTNKYYDNGYSKRAMVSWKYDYSGS